MISTLIVNGLIIYREGCYVPDHIGQMELLAQQLHQAHRNAVGAQLAALGLGEVGHPMLLTILKTSQEAGTEGQCLAQRELAERLHISPAAVANSLKSLEKGGYIRREPGTKDARRNQVLLTDKGRQAVDGCQRAFAAVSAQMLEGFSPSEREQLLSFRRRMLQNLLGQLPAKPQSKEEP